MYFLISALLVLSVQSQNLRPSEFVRLTLGSIQAQGWFKDQLYVQSHGMSRNVDEIWPDVANSGWIGGWAEGWERFPYYLDGFVGLAVQTRDPILLDKLHKHVDYILSHQEPDGWLGPIQGRGNFGKGLTPKYDPWPQFVILKALIQYAEAFPNNTRVLPSITRNLKKLDAQLDQGLEPYIWAKHRWQELTYVIHWYYDRQPEQWLLDLSKKASKAGFDWVDHFHDFKWKERVSLQTCPLACHGVNSAQAIKTGLLLWRENGDTKCADNPKRAIDVLDEYHGTPSGLFSSDELYAGLGATQGSELCTVVEYLFSLEVSAAISGTKYGATFGDRLERIAYNALPSTFDPAMKYHQYVQQTNQVICKNSPQTLWTDVGGHGNLYGVAPNYGCCTANYHQGWPKLLQHLWMKTKNGLAAVVYAPNKFQTDLNDANVTIETRTDYPFGNGTIQFIVSSDHSDSINLLFRIPAWSNNVTLSYGSITEKARSNTYHSVSVTPNITLTLHIPMTPRLEKHYKGAVSIHRGPILFSLRMANTQKTIINCKTSECDDPFDFEILPTSKWNYALKINEEDLDESIAFQENGISPLPFDPKSPPVVGRVKGREVVSWTVDEKYQVASDIPQSPVKSVEPEVVLELVPFGSTVLRVGMFPLLE